MFAGTPDSLQSERMEPAPIVAVDVPMVGDARHKHWAKIVSSVDTTKSSGWAFGGDFIAAGGIQDVPAGSVLVVYGERGSRANPQSEAKVLVAHPDGTLSQEDSATGRAWARTIRDTVVRLLDADQARFLDWAPELTAFSADALADELRRRGWKVTEPDER